MIAAVEWDLLLEVIWVSLLAGVGVTILFSLVVYASSRAAEARRSGGTPALYGALAALMFLAFMGVVIAGIAVILNKG